jgi:hypothetical protein
MSQSDDPLNDPLDRAIERTVRDLMHVEAPERLSARVMATISAAERRSSHGVRGSASGIRWMLPAFAAAAAIVIIAAAVTLLRSPARDERNANTLPAPVVTTPATPNNTTPAAVAHGDPPGPARLERVDERPRSSRSQTPHASLAAIPTAPPIEPAIGIARLDAPGPIHMREIGPPAVSFEPLAITPLEIEELGVSKR